MTNCTEDCLRFLPAVGMTLQTYLGGEKGQTRRRQTFAKRNNISRRVCPFCSLHGTQSFRTKRSEVRNLKKILIRLPCGHSVPATSLCAPCVPSSRPLRLKNIQNPTKNTLYSRRSRPIPPSNPPTPVPIRPKSPQSPSLPPTPHH